MIFFVQILCLLCLYILYLCVRELKKRREDQQAENFVENRQNVGEKTI